MKKFITTLLILVFITTSSTTSAGDTMEQGWVDDTEAVWRTGAGAHDGASTAISASIIGWGVGLALAVAILAAVLHQSNAASGHSHCGK
jgi:crotonobetainyl-CoA:carnitine CoA-transferase CaiB-like acyl-CoA transferase